MKIALEMLKEVDGAVGEGGTCNADIVDSERLPIKQQRMTLSRRAANALQEADMPELSAQIMEHLESTLKEKLIDVASSARSLKQNGHDSSSTTAELIETFRPACANSKGVCGEKIGRSCGQAPWLVRSC